MSFEPVDVYVTAGTPAAPVVGALVKVYNSSGTIFYTQAITDSDGRASFLLETLGYSLRFYKQHVGFAQPQLIDVLATPSTNQFNVTAEVLTPPIATDPRLCRASGYFRDVTGAPKRWLDIHFISKFSPLLLDGDGIVTERVHVRTDEDGYASLDLIRCAQYDAVVEALEDSPRLISVPDASSVNLPDLLFPVVSAVSFDPPGPWTVAAGSELEVTPTVTTSDGRPLTGLATDDVRWSSSDDTVMAVVFGTTSLTLRGIGAGTAELRAERLNTSIVRIPNSPISGQPVVVTVT